MYLLGFLFFISFLFQAHKTATKSFKKSWIFFLTFTFDVIILRIIIIYFEIPKILFESDLFSPVYYASSPILPSLGHLLIDTILILIISYVFKTHLIINKGIIRYNNILKNIFIAGIFILLLIVFKGLIFIFSTIIVHSSISLDLNQILNLSYFSIISYLIIAIFQMI